jgi:hypothetical protein
MSDNKCTKEKNGGVLTTIWGPSFWDSLHSISFHYPHQPTDEHKEQYKNYFKSLCHVLPCSTCAEHYTDHIYNSEKTKITDEVFENRKSLTFWLYNLHKTVDLSVGTLYDISYEDLCDKYEKCIADCTMSLEEKAIAYKSHYNKEAPIVPYEYILCFEEYAKTRGLANFLKYVNKIKSMKLGMNGHNKWIKRNEVCWEIIKSMRLNAISCLEKDGKFKGLPTIEELNLMILMSTTMSIQLIQNIIKKMGHSVPYIDDYPINDNN